MNSPKRQRETVEHVPIRVKPNPHNERYLKAKREKMGHLL
jgi:GTP cyclohydrolase II